MQVLLLGTRLFFGPNFGFHTGNIVAGAMFGRNLRMAWFVATIVTLPFRVVNFRHFFFSRRVGYINRLGFVADSQENFYRRQPGVHTGCMAARGDRVEQHGVHFQFFCRAGRQCTFAQHWFGTFTVRGTVYNRVDGQFGRSLTVAHFVGTTSRLYRIVL